MKKTALIAIAILMVISGCKKELEPQPSEPEYNLTMTITGTGTYNYQIGSVTGTGHISTTKKITGIARTINSDLILLSALADTANQNIYISIVSDIPLPNGDNLDKISHNPSDRVQLIKN